MSRSYRKAIVKDKSFTKNYWRSIRSSQNQTVRDIPRLVDVETYDIRSEKTIINDYTYRDWVFKPEFKLKPYNLFHCTLDEWKQEMIKLRRK